jgi:hypothetical protein
MVSAVFFCHFTLPHYMFLYMMRNLRRQVGLYFDNELYEASNKYIAIEMGALVYGFCGLSLTV